MKGQGAKTVNIFLTSDKLVVNNYFNRHDPSPLYMRQLSHEFETYVMESVKPATRYSVVFYKLKCAGEQDKQYAEPLMYAIKRHFVTRREEMERKFRRFKKRNTVLLAVSTLVVIICQGLIPLLFQDDHGVFVGIVNSVDIFAWVMMWRPIDELMFRWNSFTKDINTLNKLATAESILLDNEKQYVADDILRVVA
jgi:hypothetical protein